MAKSSKSQKPVPQCSTICIGELSVIKTPNRYTIMVKITANKKASGKYRCTIRSKKFVMPLIWFPPHNKWCSAYIIFEKIKYILLKYVNNIISKLVHL